MGFGRNPYVPKAQAAELKAQEASDELARARHYHEAAHEWDRAASREKPGKVRSEYEAHATRTRELADTPDAPEESDESETTEQSEPPEPPAVRPLRLLVTPDEG